MNAHSENIWSGYRLQVCDNEEIDTSRIGFEIVSETDPSVKVTCFEGYNIASTNDETEYIEDDVFDLYNISVPEHMTRRGIGTRLAELAIAEASNRGFRVGRAEVYSHRALGLLQKVQKKGRIEKIKFFPTLVTHHIPKRPTEDLLADTDFTTPDVAVNYLKRLAVAEHLEEGDEELVDSGYVDSVFFIKVHSSHKSSSHSKKFLLC